MSKTLASLVAVAGLTMAATPAFAGNGCKFFPNAPACQPAAVPELSATAAPISIALVGGLLAFGLERRRKQAKK